MGISQFQALAEFRFLIRCFLNNGEKAARSVGLEPQHYQALLAVHGLPAGQMPTIRALAERLQIVHHSAVELVDRMQKRGLLRRERSKADRRSVLIYVTPRGEKLLNRLVQHRLAELRVTAPALTRSLSALIVARPGKPASQKRRASKKRGASG